MKDTIFLTIFLWARSLFGIPPPHSQSAAGQTEDPSDCERGRLSVGGVGLVGRGADGLEHGESKTSLGFVKCSPEA